MATIFKRGGQTAGRYTVSWYDAETGKWRQKAGFADPDLSAAVGQQLERESAARVKGLTSAGQGGANAPIEGQLQLFLADCRTRGRDEGYVGQLAGRIRRVLTATGVERLVDLELAKVEAALLQTQSLRSSERNPQPISVATRNQYLAALRAFTKWATRRLILRADPLRGLRK